METSPSFNCYQCDFQTRHSFKLKEHEILKRCKPSISKKRKYEDAFQEEDFGKRSYFEQNAMSMKCDFCSFKTNVKLTMANHIARNHMKKGQKKWQKNCGKTMEIATPKTVKNTRQNVSQRAPKTPKIGGKKKDNGTPKNAFKNPRIGNNFAIKECSVSLKRLNTNDYVQYAPKQKSWIGGPARKYKCQKCTFSTNFQMSFKIHHQQQICSKPISEYACNLCEYRSHATRNVRKHIEQEHFNMKIIKKPVAPQVSPKKEEMACNPKVTKCFVKLQKLSNAEIEKYRK